MANVWNGIRSQQANTDQIGLDFVDGVTRVVRPMYSQLKTSSLNFTATGNQWVRIAKIANSGVSGVNGRTGGTIQLQLTGGASRPQGFIIHAYKNYSSATGSLHVQGGGSSGSDINAIRMSSCNSDTECYIDIQIDPSVASSSYGAYITSYIISDGSDNSYNWVIGTPTNIVGGNNANIGLAVADSYIAITGLSGSTTVVNTHSSTWTTPGSGGTLLTADFSS